MIPRILHRVWLGSAPIPEQQEQFWEKWQQLHPGWEFRTWRDDDITWIPNYRTLPQLASHSSRSDLVRFAVLQKYGGVYVDTDVEPLRSFEPIMGMPLGAFAGWESKSAICTAVMGAEPHHPATLALVKGVDMWRRNHLRSHETTQTGPGFLTHTWKHRNDVTLFPPGMFYPVPWDDKSGLGGEYPPQSFAVHHWARSWDNTPTPRKAALLVPFRPDGGQREAIWMWMRQRWERHFPDVPILLHDGGRSKLFNRARAVNRAAALAPEDTEVFIIADTDVWVAPKAVRLAVETVVDYKMPWTQTLKINQRKTSELLTIDPNKVELTQSSIRNFVEWRGQGYFGGLIVVSKAAFEAVGGMDERFKGWGFEDTAFVYAMDEVVGRKRFNGDRLPYVMMHFWHEKQEGAQRGQPIESSEKLFNEYRARRGLPPWMRRTANKEFVLR